MKKTLALLLAVLLTVTVFAGCSSNGGGGSASASPTSGSATATPAPSSDEPADDTPKAVLEGGEFALPLVDESITFTMWYAGDPGTASMTTLNDGYAYPKLEELTNVHWEFYAVSTANASENFSIAMAGNDYDDMYLSVSGYLVNGYDYYLDNDIFVDLEPLIPEYAPNYDYVRRLTDGTYITTITDTGRSAGFWQIVQTLQWPWVGPMGREDWLNNLGLAIPETYDEYHDVLVAFRDNYNPERPLSLTKSGLDDWLQVGYGTLYDNSIGTNSFSGTSSVFINKNGVATFGAFEPGFKEFITMMHDWYAEGLIDPYFYSRENAFDTAPVLNGEIGIHRGLYCNMDNLEPNARAAGDDEFLYRGFKIPVKNKGDKYNIIIGGASSSYNKFVLSTISTACENVPVLMRWVDYCYTEAGALLGNYGIEGVSFEYQDDGTPGVTDVIYHDAEGRASYNMWQKYMFAMANPYWYDWEREIQPNASQAVYDTKELFTGNYEDKYTMPVLTLTQDESGEYAKIMADINTYMSENLISLIIGETPIDSFDSVVGKIKDMGIDRAIAIQQAGLDRYLTRSK